MKKLLLVLFISLLIISCSPQKRLQRLAEKHGELITDTIPLDTSVIIPALHFDSLIEKEIANQNNDSSLLFVDTLILILEDGTQINQVDTFEIISGEKKPQKLKRKTRYQIDRIEQVIPFKAKIPYQKYEIKPPDKIDMLLANFKWFALSVLGVVVIVLVIRKLLV
ncbi:hypothetical protein [Lentimicrobium sp. S6]|uniref:hypothetical protein n=1 Tax=Lentimicrobium sp. S6 TaxID=2735872 RepID=UPI00155728FB|nr:hypothetical protein [Lentimicrobium sp. S6]NPD47500.1 hypothetical protein [Lentimicrobium sp. S6]